MEISKRNYVPTNEFGKIQKTIQEFTEGKISKENAEKYLNKFDIHF